MTRGRKNQDRSLNAWQQTISAAIGGTLNLSDFVAIDWYGDTRHYIYLGQNSAGDLKFSSVTFNPEPGDVLHAFGCKFYCDSLYPNGSPNWVTYDDKDQNKNSELQSKNNHSQENNKFDNHNISDLYDSSCTNSEGLMYMSDGLWMDASGRIHDNGR